jgi:predicted  nucleic acid-binding Zn-ribbon protein
MISTRDLENVVAQVNARFDEINNKVDKLEKEIKALTQEKLGKKLVKK